MNLHITPSFIIDRLCKTASVLLFLVMFDMFTVFGEGSLLFHHFRFNTEDKRIHVKYKGLSSITRMEIIIPLKPEIS